MLIVVNGENKNVTKNIKLEEIIINLELKDKVMAIAINMEIVKKENWSNFQIQEDDKIELLQFVGGG
ncbi:MAG: sulfur carrier protein ThiS [Campylobacterales bacterium]|nr:sulfur carrier protein ThiS [Campylobacterales bacterium]